MRGMLAAFIGIGAVCGVLPVEPNSVIGDGGAGAASQPATMPATQPAGPVVQFYGVTAKATRVVYVIDHGGSLLDNFDFLRAAVKHSVNGLSPDQSFAVVMFAASTEVMGPNRLQKATDDAKRSVIKEIDGLRAQGSCDDMLSPYQEAFETAFRFKPEVIYFLTDGGFDPKLHDIIKTLNKNQKVQINTVAFVQEDADYIVQMKQLAQDNGGQYKFVAEKDLTP